MYEKIITLRPDKPNYPLDPVWVGQGSAGKIILAAVPSAVTAVKAVIVPVGGSVAEAHAGALNATTGLWEIYIAGWSFPAIGATTYEIVLTVGTETPVSYWAGKGILTVWAASTVADIPNAPLVPHDTYVYNVTTGLYHLVTGEINDLGQPVLNTSTEGVAVVP